MHYNPVVLSHFVGKLKFHHILLLMEDDLPDRMYADYRVVRPKDSDGS